MAHLPKHALPRGNFRLTPRGVDVEVAGALVLELEEGGEEEKEEKKKKKKRRLLLFLSEFGVGLGGGRRRGVSESEGREENMHAASKACV